MYRWSKIPEEDCPEIISDISNDKFYTLKVQDWTGKKIKRKAVTVAVPLPGAASARSLRGVAWEGYYFHDSQVFKNIIDKNIPCVLMHKVKNNWAPTIDTVVCFITGDTLDVFLVHPADLIKWDPNEE